MKVLITGADGFMGRNLQMRLSEQKNIQIVTFTRANHTSELSALLQGVEVVFHLAGVNRPLDSQEFVDVNVKLTQMLASAIEKAGHPIRLVHASSTQANLKNPYGLSKLASENALQLLSGMNGTEAHIFRLPSVFGKWCRPNYNSVVATFCHNIAHGLPVQIHDPDATLSLLYIDDLLDRFINIMINNDVLKDEQGFEKVGPLYTLTVGQLERQIMGFCEGRDDLVIDRVGAGFARALYATYLSYLPIEKFSYTVPQYLDSRGVFVEMLKTPDCGQFSFFTAYPRVTRGGHYHHSKVEKFLVIKGLAHFKFRNIKTGQSHDIFTSGNKPEVVETIPGWTHDITNIGNDEMVVMLWANEIFDPSKPDTIFCPV